MSRICSQCDRGPRTKITRSHSNIANRKRQFPNLQSRVIDGKRVKVCAKCIKTASKTK